MTFNIINRTNKTRRSREHDLAQLRSDYSREKDPKQREAIVKTVQKIRRETSDVKKMREALIKEHRKGNTENIKDIHEYIKNKSRYKNE